MPVSASIIYKFIDYFLSSIIVIFSSSFRTSAMKAQGLAILLARGLYIVYMILISLNRDGETIDNLSLSDSLVYFTPL